MEEMIINNDTIEVAEEATTKTGFTGKKLAVGSAVVLGVCAAAYGVKKLWNKHKVKKALEPVDEPIDGECEVVDEKSEE